MGDVKLQIQGTMSDSPKTATEASQSSVLPTKLKGWQWWLTVSLCTFFVLVGQTVGTLLGRFYYDQGGNCKWFGPLSAAIGFPVLLPLLLLSSPPNPVLRPDKKMVLIYISIGITATADNLMYSYGLLYLPVSTFALICATQLAFNAMFSYFLNSQKFTPLIFNSIVLLTFSSSLLAVSPGSDNSSDVSKKKYPLGFILTLGASAVFSLILSVTQRTFQKIIKKETFSVVLEWSICAGFVATVASMVGLFASGEAMGVKKEMEGFAKGKVSYVMTLVSMAICWTVASVGIVGLTFVASSLFSNMISTFALPVVPIFAVIFFHDRMDGVKVVAMLIAIWGFLSYIYQDYIDDSRAKKANKVTQPDRIMLCPQS